MENKLLEAIKAVASAKPRVIIAIDGRCAAGKTTLAGKLKEIFDCNIIHADDFFLRPEQRTEARLDTAGGNIDYERLESEVLAPLKMGEKTSYRPYDCKSQKLMEPVDVPVKRITVVEGAYSCHPRLRDYYDYRIFLDIDPAKQLRRIEKRNGAEQLKVFKERWIPLEEKYFNECHTRECCDMIL